MALINVNVKSTLGPKALDLCQMKEESIHYAQMPNAEKTQSTSWCLSFAWLLYSTFLTLLLTGPLAAILNPILYPTQNWDLFVNSASQWLKKIIHIE